MIFLFQWAPKLKIGLAKIVFAKILIKIDFLMIVFGFRFPDDISIPIFVFHRISIFDDFGVKSVGPP